MPINGAIPVNPVPPHYPCPILPEAPAIRLLCDVSRFNNEVTCLIS